MTGMLIKFKYFFYKYLQSMMFQIINYIMFFFRKELGKTKKMKENVPNSKDKLSKITNSQSIEVNNILFIFEYVFI